MVFSGYRLLYPLWQMTSVIILTPLAVFCPILLHTAPKCNWKVLDLGKPQNLQFFPPLSLSLDGWSGRAYNWYGTESESEGANIL